jgi:hypothetical protein
MIIILVFEQNANFFAENCDHNIGPWSYTRLFGSFRFRRGQRVRPVRDGHPPETDPDHPHPLRLHGRLRHPGAYPAKIYKHCFTFLHWFGFPHFSYLVVFW